MRNKLHKLLVVMVFAFAVASVSLTGMKVQAEASQYVEDKADLLTDEEEETLDSMCVEYSDMYDLDIAIVTADDMEGYYFKDYASNYYIDAGYTNGFLLLIDMEDRKVFILSAGTGNDWVPDSLLNDFDDNVASYLKSEQYFDGCSVYIEDIVDALDSVGYDEEEEGPYYGEHNEEELYDDGYSDDTSSEGGIDVIAFFLKILISLGCASLITFLLVKYLGGTDSNTTSSEVYRTGRAKLLGHRDIFIREEVRKTRRSDDNDSGGSSGGSFDSGDFGGSDGADF